MKLLVAGAGGHGRVVADIAATDPAWTEIAFVDDGMPIAAIVGAWPVVGRITELGTLAGRYDACMPALGDAKLRLAHVEAAMKAGLRVPVIVHPRAWVSPRAELGAGTVVCAGAMVNIGATIGRGCIVNTGASVDHDCRLADGVHVCPGAHLAGSVSVGARSWFGIGAVARQGVRIGADVMVGAGAVCVRDIPDGVTAYGVPARERHA